MGTLKVISYNVNRSSERDSNDKVTHFIEKNSDADVYCFQLISKTLLEQVVLTLGERFSSDRAAAFAPYDDEDGFGLALLVGSPLEILSIGEHRLGDEKIYAITAAIQGFGSKPGGLPISLTVCCVHLDNTSERKRLSQLSDLQKSEALTNKEALVIGDFNGEFFCLFWFPSSGTKMASAIFSHTIMYLFILTRLRNDLNEKNKSFV